MTSVAAKNACCTRTTATVQYNRVVVVVFFDRCSLRLTDSFCSAFRVGHILCILYLMYDMMCVLSVSACARLSSSLRHTSLTSDISVPSRSSSQERRNATFRCAALRSSSTVPLGSAPRLCSVSFGRTRLAMRCEAIRFRVFHQWCGVRAEQRSAARKRGEERGEEMLGLGGL